MNNGLIFNYVISRASGRTLVLQVLYHWMSFQDYLINWIRHNT